MLNVADGGKFRAVAARFVPDFVSLKPSFACFVGPDAEL
jgi:hypothetical protein